MDKSNTKTVIRPIVKTTEEDWLEQCFGMLKERKPFILEMSLPTELWDTKRKSRIKRKVRRFLKEQAAYAYSGWDITKYANGNIQYKFYTE